jgi:hypothetical protein
MKCKEILLYLSRYQDGELDKHLREKVENHLNECRSCGQELILLERVTENLKCLPEVEDKQNFTAQVMAKVKEKRKPHWFALPSLVYYFVFIIFCLIGLILNQNLGTPKEESSILSESLHLNLIEIQDKTIEIVYNGEYNDN